MVEPTQHLAESSQHIDIVLILAAGFSLASLFGYFAEKLKLSPIFGYLIAGFCIGPYSVGYVASMEIAEQLAEVGVILMMFGVGLHFKWKDLMRVNRISIPGAFGQTLITCIFSCLFLHQLGWTWTAGAVTGMSIGVASTVVMVRVLNDNCLLNTEQGRIAIGWLIVEDLFTVMALAFLPTLESFVNGAAVSRIEVLSTLGFILFKFCLLAIFMITIGGRLVAGSLHRIAKLNSKELFTLTTLAIIFTIATGSALIFGASMALGAFIAGMSIGKTHVHQQASANALPLQDAFSTLFFIAVGMLFNPMAVVDHFFLFMSILFIVLIIKPLSAFIIVKILRYPFSIAMTIALTLAQIGEFSFILAEEAMRLKILPDEGYDVIVAVALVSISLNPLLLKALYYFNPEKPLPLEENAAAEMPSANAH